MARKARTTLAIDGDITAYNAAAGAQQTVNLGGDTDDDCIWHVTANETKARTAARLEIEELRDLAKADEVVVVLSDASHNWRQDVLPSYKANRAGKPRPIILPQMRQFLRDAFDAVERPSLEGDDVLGIYAGLKSRYPRLVIATRDKDLRGVPGLHMRMHDANPVVEEVTPAEADRFFWKQGLMGDVTDGYTGCPGFGPKAAEEWLEEPYELLPEPYVISRGKNKGTAGVKWVRKTPASSMWAGAVSIYAANGYDEDFALRQFRVARILRVTDYDFSTKQPILWSPDR